MISEPVYRTAAILVSAILAVAIVVGAVVLLMRDGGNAPIQVLPPGQETKTGNPGLPADLDVRVYISGAVHSPGVYRMLPGDRLSDAVAAAGGPTHEAQLALVNLALRVVDQAHYHIPSPSEPLPSQPGSARPSGSAQSSQADPADSRGLISSPAQGGTTTNGLININLAAPSLLETLPGIGPTLAQAIVDHRETHGSFRSVEEITDVPRIGPVTYQKLGHLVTVEGAP